MANWDNIGSSGDVEDRRSTSGGVALGGGAALVGLVLYFALNYFGLQVDPATLEQVVGGISDSQQTTTSGSGVDDGYKQFASSVLGSNDDYWKTVIKNYKQPRLVLFRGVTQSGCGVASSDVGPHYCPVDQTIYLDETFFDTLVRLGGSKGDVSQAYVIAHEAGHHVQNLLGTMDKVQSSPAYSRTGDNSLSVKLELQADCYAGLWAHSLASHGGILGPNEIEEAVQSAGAVGDDRIQEETQGSINPETWTHGSAAERVASFNTGYNTGKLEACAL